jgi:hypothetical protein
LDTQAARFRKVPAKIICPKVGVICFITKRGSFAISDGPQRLLPISTQTGPADDDHDAHSLVELGALDIRHSRSRK